MIYSCFPVAADTSEAADIQNRQCREHQVEPIRALVEPVAAESKRCTLVKDDLGFTPGPPPALGGC